MRIPTKRILFIIFVVILVAASPFAFREYREWREIREEEELEKLPIDSLEIKGATFDEALRLVVEKVHALGHPELQLRIYSNGRECPYFRGRLQEDILERASTIDLTVSPEVTVDGRKVGQTEYRIWNAANPPASLGSGSAGGMPVTLHDVMWDLDFQFGLPCALRGHTLVACHTPGTLQRYCKATIRLNKELFGDYSEAVFADFITRNGVQFYEGMSVKFRRDQLEVEVVGPRDEVEIVDTMVSPHPLSHWDEVKWRVGSWWNSVRVRYGF